LILLETKKTKKLNTMKKTLTMLAVVGTAFVSFGQGHVNFANTSGSQNVSTNTTQNYLGVAVSGGASGLVSGSGAAPSGYYYALLIQSWDGVSATKTATFANLFTSGWTYSGVTGLNGLGAGRIAGGSDATTTAGNALGALNQFAVVGWSANLGTTWASVSSALQAGTLASTGVMGISSTGTGTGIVSPPEAIFGGTGITSPFTLYSTAVPEPTTMALIALGGASLVLFRRRK
jgi:hypothetical protein